MDALELTGRARTHVLQLDAVGAALHRLAVEPFHDLCAAAVRDGIELAILSAYRDFDAQRAIWNRKFRGDRPLYDRHGQPRDRQAMTEDELLEAILSWSALPGASRHHWGSDIDVFDCAAMPPGYRVQLLPEEYAPGGVFARLAHWLDANLERFGFFRPYDVDRGGVHPEPWHISYAPVALRAADALTVDLVADTLRDADVLGKSRVLQRLPEIHRRFVANVGYPGSGAVRA
ncbi:MAG TPA: M15 family metallopeptidase [Burkholderiales bacterium]